MHIVVVYESMFGNTREIAEAIAEGARESQQSAAVRVSTAGQHLVSTADLLVVGAPTHTWSLSRPATRQEAARQAELPGSSLHLQGGATGTGIREWLQQRPQLPPRAAVFDTRRDMPAVFSGRASRVISRSLRASGVRLVCPPESFLIDKNSALVPGELARARQWGQQLALHAQPVSMRGHQDELL